ncbi:MAG: hypothetical protein ING44_00325 [Telmatospirillum sp.]|nr:hypothetical protein [Telmatospirillum sp.]
MWAINKFAFLSLLLLVSLQGAYASALEDKVGRWLKVWMSEDDAVCGKVFDTLELSLNSDQRPETLDPMFVEWRAAPEIGIDGPDRYNRIPFEVAQADITNAGSNFYVVRWHYSDATAEHAEQIYIFPSRNPESEEPVEKFFEFFDLEANAREMQFGIPIDPNNPNMRKMINLYEIVNSRPAPSGRHWRIDKGVELSIFRLGNATFVMFQFSEAGNWAGDGDFGFRYYRKSPRTHGGDAWAGVLKFTPDGRAVAVCQFQPVL